MTYLDSNILIRVITGDMPEVAHSLLQIISDGKKNEFFITDTVIAEVCFVLEFHDYAMNRHDIVDALSALFDSGQVDVAVDTVAAVKLYKKYPKLDFTDCLLLVLAKNNKAKILTLDKDLLKVIVE